MKKKSKANSFVPHRGNAGSSPCVFRRFCRGRYAVFASLHREIRIGVLTVGMLASVNLPKVQARQISIQPASEDQPDERQLTEVTVAGTLSPLNALQAARIVDVITRQQIESAAAQSVNDLLKLAVGIDVRQRGGFGIQSDISIDGGTFDQITLLLNGVNISSPHTGHLAADFPVSLSDIERIEVLEGAASRVYGASAFGGAVNIVTREQAASPHAATFEAGVQGGSYATFGADARAAFHPTPSSTTAGHWNSSLSATFQRSDGTTLNSDFLQGRAFHRTVYDAPDFRIQWQAGYSEKSYGANTFYSAAYPNQWEHNRRFVFSAGAETKGRLRLRPEVFWNRLYDNFQLIRDTPTGENHHRSDVHGARITAELRWAAGRTAAGAELREENIRSSSLGLPVNEPRTGLWGARYTQRDERTNLSFNAEHTLVLPHFTASVGLLANRNTRFDSRFRIYPGIDIAFSPNAQWRIYASYNKGFRLPTFTELYYKSPTHEGNQGMKAEESHSLQLGATHRIQFAAVSLHSTLKAFYHRGHNLIDWVMYAPDDVFHSASFELDNMGIQAQTQLQAKPLSLQLAYTYLHQHRRDDAEIFKSNYAMEYLRHKVVATLDHRIVSRLSAAWTFRWQDRMGCYLRYEDAHSTGQLADYSPYATLDLKLRWQDTHYELWAEGTNLTNHRYYDLGNVPQPGIVVLAGVRVKL